MLSSQTLSKVWEYLCYILWKGVFLIKPQFVYSMLFKSNFKNLIITFIIIQLCFEQHHISNLWRFIWKCFYVSMIVLNTGMYSLLYMYILTRNSDLNRWSLIYFLQMDEYECSRNHVNESQQPKTIIVKEYCILSSLRVNNSICCQFLLFQIKFKLRVELILYHHWIVNHQSQSMIYMYIFSNIITPHTYPSYAEKDTSSDQSK